METMVMDSNRIYVVPDIHGRQFWHDVEKLEDYDLIVFLGDYVDPYPDEGISPEEGLRCLKDVLEFAKTHENVVLLLGNHDATYMLDTYVCECRTDHDNFPEIRKLFRDNKEMFKLAYCIDTNEGQVLFTHAGVLPDWLDGFDKEEYDTPVTLADMLNAKLYELVDGFVKGDKNIIDNSFLRMLSVVSYYRGGWRRAGSCIWSDIREHFEEEKYSEAFQVVGHTQLKEGTIIRLENIACVDSHKVWRLSDILSVDSIK